MPKATVMSRQRREERGEHGDTAVAAAKKR
jgi:hypothetical protein